MGRTREVEKRLRRTYGERFFENLEFIRKASVELSDKLKSENSARLKKLIELKLLFRHFGLNYRTSALKPDDFNAFRPVFVTKIVTRDFGKN